MKNKVITTRIDNQLAHEIGYLKDTFGTVNTSKIVIEAIHFLYSFKKDEETKKSPLEMFEQAGLIGFINAKRTDLSTNYKKEIEQYVEDKLSTKKTIPSKHKKK